MLLPQKNDGWARLTSQLLSTPQPWVSAVRPPECPLAGLVLASSLPCCCPHRVPVAVPIVSLSLSLSLPRRVSVVVPVGSPSVSSSWPSPWSLPFCRRCLCRVVAVVSAVSSPLFPPRRGRCPCHVVVAVPVASSSCPRPRRVRLVTIPVNAEAVVCMTWC
jgi:hypothetical protein